MISGEQIGMQNKLFNVSILFITIILINHFMDTILFSGILFRSALLVVSAFSGYVYYNLYLFYFYSCDSEHDIYVCQGQV